MHFKGFIFAAALLWPATSSAANLGCFEPNDTVELVAVFSTGGTLTDPTSPVCNLLAPGGTSYTTCGTPTKPGSLTGVVAISGGYDLGASPTEGNWYVYWTGTVGGTALDPGEDTFEVKAANECYAAQAITAYAPAVEDGGRLQTIDTLLASLCQADGRHFTISGTPTDTEFDTDYSAPDDFGLSDSPGLSAYVWILYANGDVDAGRLADITNANGHMTLSTALTSGAPSSGDEGCLSIGVNP